MSRPVITVVSLQRCLELKPLASVSRAAETTRLGNVAYPSDVATLVRDNGLFSMLIEHSFNNDAGNYKTRYVPVVQLITSLTVAVLAAAGGHGVLQS